MGNKVLLIRPKNIYGINNYPSLGLISLATALADAGFEPVIVNCCFEAHPKQAIVKHLRDSMLIGVTMMTSEVPHAYEMLRFVNQVANMPVVVGGWHVTLFPEQFRRSNLVNFVVQGPGEVDIVRLAKRVVENKNCSKMCPHTEPDIAQVPLADYGLDPNVERFITSPLTDIASRRWLPYESSRGCLSNCRFCCNTVAGKTKWQGRAASVFRPRLIELRAKYGIGHFKFVDDNFFVDPKRVEGMIGRALDGCTWDAECRADVFRTGHTDDHLLNGLKRSGLTQLTIGIESGSQKSLDLMDKRITLEQAEYAVAQCDKYGIVARCSFIIEVPGETKADIEATRKFVNKLRRYKHFTCGVQTFRPYPRCELTKSLTESGQWREPNNLHAWTLKNNVEVFTKAQMRLPWQVRPKRSERIGAYQSMESCISLGTHNLRKVSDKLLCLALMKLAAIRNRLGVYFWPFDLWLYRRLERKVREQSNRDN